MEGTIWKWCIIAWVKRGGIIKGIIILKWVRCRNGIGWDGLSEEVDWWVSMCGGINGRWPQGYNIKGAEIWVTINHTFCNHNAFQKFTIGALFIIPFFCIMKIFEFFLLNGKIIVGRRTQRMDKRWREKTSFVCFLP